MSKKPLESSTKREVKPRVRGRPVGGVIADTPIAQRLGRWLRQHRLSYARAGERLDVHPATVQRWVCGDVEPSPVMLELIEKALAE